MEISQENGRPLVDRQRGDDLRYFMRQFAVFGSSLRLVLLRRGMAGHSIIFQRRRSPQSPGAAVVQASVFGDSKQPGEDLALPAERMGVLPNREKHVLRQILGGVPVGKPQESLGEMDHGAVVRVDQLRKGGPIATRSQP